MKRILPLLLCLAIACSFSGCSFLKPLRSTYRIQGGEDSGVIYTEHKTDTGYSDDIQTSQSSQSHIEGGSSGGSSSSGSSQSEGANTTLQETGRYYYDNMNTAQRTAYEKVYAAVSTMSGEYIPLSGLTNLGDVVLAYTGVRNDYPEFFWLSGHFKWAIDNDTFYIMPSYTCTAEEMADMQKQLDLAVTEFVNSVSGVSGDYEKELAAFNWLAARATYDDKTATSPDAEKSDRHAFSAWGAIVKRTDTTEGEEAATAVCEGYSRAFTLLLSKVGIRSTVVSGTLNEEPHMWNIVNLGGEWYNVDVTVSDTDDTERYLLFNVTDKSIKPHYLWDTDFAFTDFSQSEVVNAFNFKLPHCISNTYNYLALAGRVINLEDTAIIDEQVLKAYENGENKCEFALADSSEYTYSAETAVQAISFPQCVSSLAAKNPNLKFTISGIPGTRGFIIHWS